MFQYQNAFAVLNETKRAPVKQKRYRKRIQAFPPLSNKKVVVPTTELNYKTLIPNLNDWKVKSKNSDYYNHSPTNRRQHSSEDEDEGNQSPFNQVWCVEKEKSTIFESDMYTTSDTDQDSFIYNEDAYDSF